MRKHLYLFAAGMRIAILALLIGNLGIAIGILQNPTLATPGRIEANLGIPAYVLAVLHLIGAMFAVLALRDRNFDLFLLSSLPIVIYTSFAITGVFFEGTCLPAGIFAMLVLFLINRSATWKH